MYIGREVDEKWKNSGYQYYYIIYLLIYQVIMVNTTASPAFSKAKGRARSEPTNKIRARPIVI
jgi:hypothetical protein